MASGPVTLAEAQERFQREAVRGVIDTGRYRAAYYSWGEGPPLTFIHGLGDNSRAFLLPVARLSHHFRCVAYDLPTGRGDGARLRGYSHADLTADLFAVLDHLGLRQSYVCGSSFGSTVALAALKERPERLPRGILQGGFARRPLAGAEKWLARLARFLPGTMARLPLREKALERGHRGPFAAAPEGVWEHFLRHTGETGIATLARHALLLHRTDLRPILKEVRQPVLLICGDRDPLVRKEHEEVLLAGLPNAGRVEIENCGHFPYFSHPDVLAEVVRQFLTPARTNGERGASAP
ncbi:MAG TPA: alpha/beta fold hydrolase [Gemmataceae bacterium]|nr:alpha/beta fold hydrolase [Gemmataceae bacterium]